jgi:Rrf2 family protein
VKLTRKGECALLGAIYLIKQGEDNVSYVGEIANNLGLPQKLLAQVFYKMALSGLLKSHRGRGGGFSMALPPGDITVKDVIEAVQGKPTVYRCVAEGAACTTFKKCSVQDIMFLLQERTMETLDGITLNELAEGMVFK